MKTKLDFYPNEWDFLFAHCDFTDSEKDVIALMRRGMYQEDIAAELYVSRSTVKRRKAAIFRKINHCILSHK